MYPKESETANATVRMRRPENKYTSPTRGKGSTLGAFEGHYLQLHLTKVSVATVSVWLPRDLANISNGGEGGAKGSSYCCSEGEGEEEEDPLEEKSTAESIPSLNLLQRLICLYQRKTG